MDVVNIPVCSCALALEQVLVFREDRDVEFVTKKWLPLRQGAFDTAAHRDNQKLGFRKVFPVGEIRQAEILCDAIVWYHGAWPTIEIGDKTVTVVSPGYEC